jgi:FlaA1/EpsC-like NDP-sugar epimerase
MKRDIRLVRKTNVAELLGREVIPLQIAEAKTTLKGRVILVTGAAGSIGSELCRQLLNYEPEVVIALDNNETGLFDLAEDLRSHTYGTRLRPYIADITDRQRLESLFEEVHPHFVFHAAACKHVPLLEFFPAQAIRTNVLATYHLCLMARKCGVTRFVFVSTDKAANPASVMGASKRFGEMIIQSLAREVDSTTCFYAVRFGNVIGSRGSVVPLFAQQIERGGPVTVTHPDATRYFMTIAEACGLIITTTVIAEKGGLYLLDMGEPVRIIDLALRMLHSHALQPGRDVQIVFTGLRPGDRLHESLVAPNEELVPTNYSKIFSVASIDNVPALITLAQWIATMEYCLLHDDNVHLKTRLFETVQRQDLIVAS